eukprot:3621056-Pyramimonas_sp.AAC.1
MDPLPHGRIEGFPTTHEGSQTVQECPESLQYRSKTPKTAPRQPKMPPRHPEPTLSPSSTLPSPWTPPKTIANNLHSAGSADWRKPT